MQSSCDRQSIDKIVNEIRSCCPQDASITFLNGDFNVVHPGHLRLLNFANECGDFLVVGVNGANYGKALVKDDLRLQNIRSISIVDFAFLLEFPVVDFIAALKPDAIIKGKEHENSHNEERAIVEHYGGELLFGSGELRFSSLDLLHSELSGSKLTTGKQSQEFLKRHQISPNDLESLVDKISSLNVIVLGDVIVDEYVTCEPLGMSQEDPTIVVSPLTRDTYLGGAGIVAAHAKALGASATFYSVVGQDASAEFARNMLEDYAVQFDLIEDTTRPTPHKKRYRAHGKTLLRVSDLRHHEIHADMCSRVLKNLQKAIPEADLLIFSDFNYGFLPQPLVESVIKLCQDNGVFVAADSQASSQYSDVSRFKGANLATPTEREARLACQDFSSGVTVLAQQLQSKMDGSNIILSLGSEGILIQSSEESSEQLATDQLPAFNLAPVDTAGAGDSMIASAAMCMASGANIWRASYLGSIAAACQVSRLGNTPLSPDLIKAENKP